MAEDGGEKDRDMGEPQGAGAAAAPGSESSAGRVDVILTPDQRVRVFISSTMGELAAERAAARRAIARLHLVESPKSAQLLSLIVTEALGEKRARELRARGADMDWDQAVAYALTQTTQALSELQSGTQP
jgi:hypothetical protein